MAGKLFFLLGKITQVPYSENKKKIKIEEESEKGEERERQTERKGREEWTLKYAEIMTPVFRLWMNMMEMAVAWETD